MSVQPKSLIALEPTPPYLPIIDNVVKALPSKNSREAYRTDLIRFAGWLQSSQRPFNRAAVLDYRQYLMPDDDEPSKKSFSVSSINRALCAIRRLAKEIFYNGAMDQTILQGIVDVAGHKAEGEPVGIWLNDDDRAGLWTYPAMAWANGKPRIKGHQEKAMIALMLAAGLRVSEVATVRAEQIALIDGRWAIVDLLGKGNKTRTIPLPVWAKDAIAKWLAVAGVKEGVIVRSVDKGGNVGGGITPQAIERWLGRIGVEMGKPGLSPHDLRRSYARWLYRRGSDIAQIQKYLGHAQIETTRRYVNAELDLSGADRLESLD